MEKKVIQLNGMVAVIEYDFRFIDYEAAKKKGSGKATPGVYGISFIPNATTKVSDLTCGVLLEMYEVQQLLKGIEEIHALPQMEIEYDV